MCVRACVRVCVRACVRACVCVCGVFSCVQDHATYNWIFFLSPQLVSLIKSELLTKKTDLLHVLNITACAVKAGDST